MTGGAAAGAGAMWLVAALCLWARRKSWAYGWEVATSANIAGLATWLIFSDPALSTAWHWLRLITGIPNCENLLGNIAYLAGVTALTHSMINRIGGIDRAAMIQSRIEFPATLFLPTLVGTYAVVIPERDIHDIFGYDATTGLACYLLLLSVGRWWVLGHLAWALLIIRRDSRSKAVATIYLASVAVNCLAVLSMSVGALWDDYADMITWYLAFAATLGYVLGSWYSWRRKKIEMANRHTPLAG